MIKIILLALTFALAWSQTNMVICSKNGLIPAPKGVTPLTAGTVIWNYDCVTKACIQATVAGSVIKTDNAFDTQDACNTACRAGLTCHNPTANLNPIKVCNAPTVLGTTTTPSDSCMGPRAGFSFVPAQGACVAATVQCTDKATPNFFAKQDACTAFCSEAAALLAAGTTTTVAPAAATVTPKKL